MRVWFNASDMVFTGRALGGFFDVPHLEYTSLLSKQDTTGCEDRCELVSNPSDAHFLVSEKYPASKSGGHTQHTVHMTLESKEYVPAPQNFDLAADLSLRSNVPLMLAPVRFWERLQALPLPTAEDVRGRRLALWTASNCCRTTWDRQGFVQEVHRSLQALGHAPGIDSAGRCLNNSPIAAADLPKEYSESILKGCTDGQSGGGRTCTQTDASAGEKTRDVLGRYLFVFSMVNAIENTNVDEKFYEPFLGNSVPVVIAPREVQRAAPAKNSFVDATQFDSPSALARHLLWLAEHPEEYLKFFDFRRAPAAVAGPSKDLRDIDATGVFQTGTLCRLCSCLCDPGCMRKRDVGKCGYR